MGRVLVVGFGNPLMGDDGAGPAVIDRLNAAPLPPCARCEDGGSDSLRLPSLWQGERDVWLIDAVAGDAPPGTIHRLDHTQVIAVRQRHATVHRLSLPESLRWIALAYPAMADVRYTLWGIEVSAVRVGAGLSSQVAAAVDAVAAEILSAVARAPAARGDGCA